MDSKKLTAEFIGTLALIFIGAGAGAVSGSLVAVALAHGLVIVGMAYSLGDISGIHINPAVTAGLAAGGKISWSDAVGYIIAQLLGAVVGALLLAVVIGFPTEAGHLGNTVLGEFNGSAITPVQGDILEAMLTFFLVNTITIRPSLAKLGTLPPWPLA